MPLPRYRRIAAVLLVSAVASVGAFTLMSGVAAPVPASVTDSVDAGEQTAGEQEAAVAKLVIREPGASIRREGKTEFKSAKDGAKLRVGDTIQTDGTGFVEIRYTDDSFTRLDVNTTFTIVSLSDDEGNRQIEGSLESGRAWNRTSALTESESFEQEGAGATAAVVGTAFLVTCTSPNNCVFTAVVDGVQLKTVDGELQLLDPLTECTADEITDSDSNLCSVPTPVSLAALLADGWIADNIDFDTLEGFPGPVEVVGTVIVDDETGEVTFIPASPASDEEPPEEPPEDTSSVFDGSPGSGPDPLLLGPYAMTAFADDTRPNFEDVNTVAAPGGGNIGFSVFADHRETPYNGWSSWNSNYTGDVYCVSTNCGPIQPPPNGFTITMPSNTVAFSFYAQSDYFGVFDFVATASDGTSSGTVAVDNANPSPCAACAAYFGFYMPDPSVALVSITINVTPTDGVPHPGIGIGQFAIARDPGATSLGAPPLTAESMPPPDEPEVESPPTDDPGSTESS